MNVGEEVYMLPISIKQQSPRGVDEEETTKWKFFTDLWWGLLGARVKMILHPLTSQSAAWSLFFCNCMECCKAVETGKGPNGTWMSFLEAQK